MSEAEIRSGVEQPDLTSMFRLGYKVTATVFSPSENPTTLTVSDRLHLDRSSSHRKTTVKNGGREGKSMSTTDDRETRACVSCGLNIAGTNAAAFKCPDCGQQIYRCAKCRKQSNLYECPDCGFTGP